MGHAKSTGVGAGSAFAPGAFRGQSVLVADDDAAVRSLITQLLRDAGADVREADCGPALFELLAEVAASRLHVDVLVCDDRMPGSSASSVLVAVRALPVLMPVIIITGGSADATLLAQLGAQSTLRKPFHLADLHAAVSSAARSCARPREVVGAR